MDAEETKFSLKNGGEGTKSQGSEMMEENNRRCTVKDERRDEEQEEEETSGTTGEPSVDVGTLSLEKHARLECVFGECVQQVGRLQRRRDVLVQELLQEEGRMQEDVQTLRLQLEQTRSRLDRAQLHKLRLQEEVMSIKRKLFSVTRECIQSQVTMAAQRYEVAQFAFIQEDLQSQVLQQMQEMSELQEEQRCRLTALRERLQRPPRPRAMSDLSSCRRASWDFTRHTRADMQALQEWYEPRLLALMRRRRASEEALKKSGELLQELKKHLHPLLQETHTLHLQRDTLQNQLHLLQEERQEHLHLHQESVSALEGELRELQAAIQIQIHINRELTELKECLREKSLIYRKCLGYTEESDTKKKETEDI